MSRNTFLLIILLTVIATFLTVFNIQKSIHPERFSAIQPIISVTATPTPPQQLSYKNSYCGISLTYPSSLALQEGATGSAAFVDAYNDQNTVTLTCQKKIPTISLAPEKIDMSTVAGQPARVYHGLFGNNATPLTITTFHNTKTNVDILVSGATDTFTGIVKSIRLLP